MSDGRQLHAVILAGGLGTRLRPVLSDLPKPMASVQGRPFLEWIIRFLAHNGYQRQTISTGYLAEKIAAYFESNPIAEVLLDFVQEDQPLGTAGALLHCVNAHSDQHPDAWLLVNGDSMVCADISRLPTLLGESGADAAMIGLRVPDTSRYGSLQVSETGLLQAFLEKQPGSGIINAGIYLLSPEMVADFPAKIPLSIERDVFPALLQQGRRIIVHTVTCPFLDIGTPESLAMAAEFVKAHLGFLSQPRL